MKEDILEQIVDDYLQFQAYFTTHNVRFKRDSNHLVYVADLDRVPSDVDVVALHPRHTGSDRVLVVSCKSWQMGFNPRKKLTELRKTPARGNDQDGITSGNCGVRNRPKRSETRSQA